tara:strand:+ start:4499 stop:4963 length:465 start_codon:yes stop_codon:yes gene_type:complete
MNVIRLSFEQISSVWQEHLWPNRQSPIETHSAMTWPYEGDPVEYDMDIFKYPATFFGAVVGHNQIIGVNSGHRTTEGHYRSRGIWVNPENRRLGISQLLFEATKNQAITEGCNMIWSIPRKIALPAYTKFGFETVGDYIKTETSESNIYVKLLL